MLNGNEMKAFYRIFFPKRPDESGLAARVPDVNETRLNDNFKTIGDEFRKIWEFIKNGFKTKSLTVDGQLSAGSAALGDTNVNGALDVDGSATFDGVLDITPRRCNAALSSFGWYRVLTYTGTTEAGPRGATSRIIRLRITRSVNNNNNELHEISLLQNYDSVSFANETSKSNVQLIDKIRATYNGNEMYVDLHYNGSSENSVYVDFDVYSSQAVKRIITSSGLTAVAESPGGETEMTRYTFSADGTGDLNVNGTVAGQGFADLLFGVGNSIPSNTDCDSLTTEGKYTCYSSAIAGTLTNPPYTSAFGMLVIRVAEAQRLVQVAMPNGAPITVKLRYYNGTSWTAWKTLTPS